MNERQIAAKDRLQKKLGVELRIECTDEAEYLFTVVQGVTVIVGPAGGYILPAVRTYSEGLETAVNASEFWEIQKRRDDADLEKARGYETGHLSPIVNVEWECGNPDCGCHSQNPAKRRQRSLPVSRKT
jgi:hypothetical protein